jgi:hypothetical protein
VISLVHPERDTSSQVTADTSDPVDLMKLVAFHGILIFVLRISSLVVVGHMENDALYVFRGTSAYLTQWDYHRSRTSFLPTVA